MRIGDIAKLSHVSKSIIRYYEDKGLLPRAVRDSAGYREYGDAELSRILFVTSARRIGCTFGEIKAMIDMQEQPCPPSPDVLQLLSHKILEVEDEMQRLRLIQRELLRLQELRSSLAHQVVATEQSAA